MRLLSRRDPFAVGVVALVVLGIVSAALTVLSATPFGKRSYTAVLAHTAGLRAGESVQVAGVDLGEVRSTQLVGDKVEVEFVLDKDVQLGRETTATVKVATLLGTHYLAIDPKGGGQLRDGTIPMAQTAVPFNLQDVIDETTRELDELDTAQLARAFDAVAETLRASGRSFGPALDGITRLSKVVVARSDQFGDLLAATRDVSDQLSASTGDLLALMRASNLVIEELTRRRAAIHTLLVNTQRLSATLSGIVEDNEAELKPALADLRVVLQVLREREKTVATLNHHLAVSARYIANTTGNGPWAELYKVGGDDNVSCATGDC